MNNMRSQRIKNPLRRGDLHFETKEKTILRQKS